MIQIIKGYGKYCFVLLFLYTGLFVGFVCRVVFDVSLIVRNLVTCNLVEPGLIKTNFSQALVITKKSQDPNSPYSQMMQKLAIVTSQLEQSGSTPDLVAKVVLNAVTSENPNLRYLVGKDVEE